MIVTLVAIALGAASLTLSAETSWSSMVREEDPTWRRTWRRGFIVAGIAAVLAWLVFAAGLVSVLAYALGAW